MKHYHIPLFILAVCFLYGQISRERIELRRTEADLECARLQFDGLTKRATIEAENRLLIFQMLLRPVEEEPPPHPHA